MKVGARLASRARKVALRLERDLHFVMFYLLPELEGFEYDYGWISRRTGLAERKARAWADDLIACGLWELSAQKGALRIRVVRKQLDLGRMAEATSPVAVFMSLTAQMQGKLAGDGTRSWFEMNVQTASPEALLAFKRKVLQAQEELRADSERAGGSLMVAYNFQVQECRPAEIGEDSV